MDSGRIGQVGERTAEMYLTERGARVLARNYRARGGEIDLIVEWDGVIVFVEVKARSHGFEAEGLEAITRAKRRRICRAALAYLHQHHSLERSSRFDAVEVLPSGVRHLPSAFEYEA